MAFEIPQSVYDFFGLYPVALSVWVDQDGKAYMNHFEAKAVKDAIAAGKDLYQVDKNFAVTVRVPEVLYIYQATCVAPPDAVEVAGFLVVVDSPNQLEDVEGAIQTAFDNAEISDKLFSFLVSEELDQVTITTRVPVSGMRLKGADAQFNDFILQS
jgi:hypothetical protein